MTLDQILAFERIVREGSFLKASISLQIGQPAISARIRSLEEECGPLFLRGGKRITLTARGEALYTNARKLIDLYMEVQNAATDTNDAPGLHASIGILNSLAPSLLEPILEAFHRKYPSVTVLAWPGDNERVWQMLLDRVVDLAFVVSPEASRLGANATVLGRFWEDVSLYASPDLLKRLPTDFLKNEDSTLKWPLLLPRWWMTHPFTVRQYFKRFSGVCELPVESAKRLTISGVGVGLLSRQFCTDEIRSRTLVPLDAGFKPIPRESCLIKRAGKETLSSSNKQLVDALIREGVRRKMVRRQAPV
ncbi:LysR family transcriptional regulator [Burkholderia glumae]|uniref:LysR family transcriptional regulator n=1 Tax=Burkholderia glumae TaxID=337 RepID=UPI002150DC8E|nr:LysR family transcriptional regulator [Burkholderia glumae]